MSGQKKNKAILFTTDAVFAGLIVVVALITFSQNFIYEDKNPDLGYLSYDLVKSFSSIKTYELNNSYLISLINSGVINNTNNTLLETIGELYVLNKTSEAEKLAENISLELIPEKYGFAIAINNETVYSNEKPVENNMMTAKRLISGIEKYKPIRGSTSKVYLEGLEEKKDSSYIFFGGFIGQGNISDFTDEIPTDANITYIYAEMEIGDVIGDNFYIFFNGVRCSINLTKNSPPMTADSWNLTSCKGNITPGQRNNISIIPATGDLDTAYISGGFLRFDYTTKQMYSPKKEGYTKIYFPSIDGLINIYSSVYIPGNITYMFVVLNYTVVHTNESNSSFYMKIGNITVFRDNYSTTNIRQSFGGDTLEQFGMNYSFLSGKNIPIRLGAENLTYFFQYIGTADAVLVTDVSGSMDYEMGSNNAGTQRNCNDSNINDSDTQRLSVAKCLDKTFVTNMLNITGNLIGLVSYTTATNNITDLINNNTKLTNDINYYTSLDSTCICCGINSGAGILSSNLNKTILISNSSRWYWTNTSFGGEPGNDSSGNRWYDFTYDNETQWNLGNATLGHGAGTAYLRTDMGGIIFTNYSHPFMWENSSDNATAEADFTHGWNSTGSKFGNATANNGWDYSNGTAPYGYSSTVNFTGPKNGLIIINISTTGQNRCTNRDCSGAYGLEINITPELFEIINQTNGKILFGFNYGWTPNPTNPFDNSDELWFKARWTSPTSGVHYLGSELSSVDGDNTFEIYRVNNPDTSVNGYFLTNVLPFVEGPGNYYIDFGIKLLGSSSNDWGYARFDNVSIMISNLTETYYLRKHFNVTNLDLVKKGFMNLMSDNSAKVYLNGNLVFSDDTKNNASYWNTRGFAIDQDYFRLGNNTVAVELFSGDDFSRFNMELFGINDSRNKAMLVMTDGEANVESGCPQPGDAKEAAIQAACDAREHWGITTYAVGYSEAADETTLADIAECGGGVYIKSDNTSILNSFYKNVAAEIMDVARIEQRIVVTGSPVLSKLYGTQSYIEINYTMPVGPPQIGDISVNFEQPLSYNCTFNVNISPKLSLIDSKVTSYSSSKWTDFLFFNNETVYNLSIFNSDYQFLGDPFIVSFLPTKITPGNLDNITIRTGIEPVNSTGCSANDTFIYSGLLKSTISYSEVLEFAEGCKWTVEFEDNSTTVINVPQTYEGSNDCSYRHSNLSYNINDTYDDAVYKLFSNLDLDDDGRIDVNLLERDLVIGAISVSKVPYPWGPAIAEVRIWQ